MLWTLDGNGALGRFWSMLRRFYAKQIPTAQPQLQIWRKYIFRIISHIVHIKVGSHSSALIHVSKTLSETAQHYPKVTQTSASKTPSAQMLSINIPSVWFIESRKPFQVKPAKQSPAHLPGDVRASIWVPRCWAYKVSWFGIYKMGFVGGLVWFPGEPKNKPKIGALQNACPKFISRPQTQSSYKLVSYRMVGLEICLTCTCPTSPGNPAIFFPKNTLFTKWHGWPEKNPYKMPSFVTKMPLEWNMGQAIS